MQVYLPVANMQPLYHTYSAQSGQRPVSSFNIISRGSTSGSFGEDHAAGCITS